MKNAPPSHLYWNAIHKNNHGRPPVWFMRQAGRYHSHYQMMKRTYTFMDLCKIPEAAAEVTFGPIRDFDFDAAIMFSDLLFPLEVLGMGLEYKPGPKLGWHLSSVSDLKKLNPKNLSAAELVQGIGYQARALQLIRKGLSPEKALLGFVGGPLTLFYYAVQGSHQNRDAHVPGDAQAALTDGRWSGFLKHLMPLLLENLSLQASNGADAIAIMDTCAGEIDAPTYAAVVVPVLRELMIQFRRRHPNTPLVYYSKGTGPQYWQHLTGMPFECLGIDHHYPMDKALLEFGDRWSIQGNFNQEKMLLPLAQLRPEMDKFFNTMAKLPREKLRGWVCGLGHGILQWTPEENVRAFLKLQKEVFTS